MNLKNLIQKIKAKIIGYNDNKDNYISKVIPNSEIIPLEELPNKYESDYEQPDDLGNKYFKGDD